MRWVGWLAALVLLFLTGCGGDPEPKFAEPSQSPSASAATPVKDEPEPPAMPEAAKEHSKAGAEAFTRYWVDVGSYTNQTLDTSVFRGTYLDGCVACRKSAKMVDDLANTGGKSSGGVWRVAALRIDVSNIGVAQAKVEVSSSKQVVAIPGKRTQIWPKASGRNLLLLVPQGESGWKVGAWQGETE